MSKSLHCERLGAAIAQCVGDESVQLRTRARVAQDALPCAVADLLLKEAGEIHNLVRLVLRQRIHDRGQSLATAFMAGN